MSAAISSLLKRVGMALGVLIAASTPTTAFADGWGEWRQMDDNSQNQIWVRTKENTFKYEGGAHEWYWQFRSDYSQPVKFDYEVSCREGGRPATRNTEALRPGQQSSTGGSWTICQKISVRVGRVRKS
jgi:hypothetical protein